MSDKKLTVNFDEKQIDAIFTEVDRCHGPGAAVGIAVEGRPVYRRGFGLASMELPVVLSPATRMPIGSTTKHFTCLAYMLLCEDGRASLDDTIGKYLPEFQPVMHGITMRQLMGHIGGLRDTYDIIALFSGVGVQVTAADSLSLYRDIDDMNSVPGTAWSYNNAAYVVLAAVIEKITGQAFRDVLRERIFEPVGMFDTLLRPFDRDFLPGAATLHAIGPRGTFEKGFRFIEGGGQGGIYSTVNDMLRWLRHMDSPVVGTPETWTLMKTPMTLAHGASTGYGLGLMRSDYRGVAAIHHGGGVVGGNSQMIKVPGARLDIAIMVNSSHVFAAALTNRVMDACLPNLDPPGVAAETKPVSGIFRSPKSGRVVQLSALNDQQVASIDGADMIFVTDANGVLTPPPGMPMRQSITLIGPPDNASAIRLSEFDLADEYVALRPLPHGDAGRVAGRYRSETTGTDVTISANGELRTVGRFGSALYEIESLAENIWRGRLQGTLPVSAILSFEDDGRVLRFASGRTRAVTFRRV